MKAITTYLIVNIGFISKYTQKDIISFFENINIKLLNSINMNYIILQIEFYTNILSKYIGN